MAPLKIRNYSWKKPPTFTYEHNLDYVMNNYQPLIEYLDQTEKTKAKSNYPHLASNKSSGELNDRSTRNAIDHQLALRDKSSRLQIQDQNSSVKKSSTFSNFKQLSGVDKKLSKSANNLDKMNFNEYADISVASALQSAKKITQAKSAKAIAAQLLYNKHKQMSADSHIDIAEFQRHQVINTHDSVSHNLMMSERLEKEFSNSVLQPLDALHHDLKGFERNTSNYFLDKSKQTSIEIEQLNARVVEAETRLKTEVTRIKKKLQIQITELEMSLDVANKTNIDLQKVVKKQSLQLTEIQASYEEIQRQLTVTLDQLSVSSRRVQSLTAEVEEIRSNYESALRSKRQAEQQYEESQSRVNELTTININLASSKSKIEQELATIANDYDEVTKELRVSDERYQRVQVELKHTVEILHEEQERIVKIEAIKKSLEIEVKNLSVRLEEVEANAIVGGKRIISKLEARLRDLELELDEEKRRHAETIKILRKKERSIKEVMIQCEEDQKSIALLQEALDKTNQKVGIYKRQLYETENSSQQSVTRVRRFQRELEAAEERADTAESNLTLIRAKHRTFVTTSTVPGSQVYLVQESSRQSME